MYFFIADEHLGHHNIIKYCKRPFDSVEEMDATIIKNFNSVVSDKDHTIHAGDFTFKYSEQYIRQLNGTHTFLRGNHDRWMGKQYHEIWGKTIEGQHIIACHYAMRVWNRSHYGSWQVYGHSHGNLPPIGLQWDVGVDNNSYYPVSFDQLKEIMKEKKMDRTMQKLKSRFLELRKLFKKYGNKCIYNHNGTCREPTMGWGGMAADTECRIDNCPFILYEEVK